MRRHLSQICCKFNLIVIPRLEVLYFRLFCSKHFMIFLKLILHHGIDGIIILSTIEKLKNIDKRWRRNEGVSEITKGYVWRHRITGGNIEYRVKKGSPLGGVCDIKTISDWYLELMAKDINISLVHIHS